MLLFRRCLGRHIPSVIQPKETTMQVLFTSRHPQATDLRDLAERRVRFVLRRLAWLVPRAEVQMSDVNGPRGGIDKRCQVELRTALDNALARAARYVMRQWRRSHDTRRLRQRMVALLGRQDQA
jgi:hypothetical protein